MKEGLFVRIIPLSWALNLGPFDHSQIVAGFSNASDHSSTLPRASSSKVAIAALNIDSGCQVSWAMLTIELRIVGFGALKNI